MLQRAYFKFIYSRMTIIELYHELDSVVMRIRNGAREEYKMMLVLNELDSRNALDSNWS